MAQLAKLSVESIALPIGNFGDIGTRALGLLKNASVIFCEDTRKVHSLLESQNIHVKSKWIAIPGDEEWKFDFTRLAEHAKDGDSWVIVSDAGTPIINDPGRALVEWARKENLPVSVIPGPSAVTAALQWSGGFGVPFVFLGFAPKEKSTSAKSWERFFAPAQSAATVIFFDTKHQIVETLEALIKSGHGENPLHVAREISKEHEELLSGSVEEMKKIFEKRSQENKPIGELTLVMKGFEEMKKISPLSLADLKAFRAASTKDASKWAAQVTGLSARDCYQALIEDKE